MGVSDPEVRKRSLDLGPEHQATGPIPQPTDNTHSGSRLLLT